MSASVLQKGLAQLPSHAKAPQLLECQATAPFGNMYMRKQFLRSTEERSDSLLFFIVLRHSAKYLQIASTQ